MPRNRAKRVRRALAACSALHRAAPSRGGLPRFAGRRSPSCPARESIAPAASIRSREPAASRPTRSPRSTSPPGRCVDRQLRAGLRVRREDAAHQDQRPRGAAGDQIALPAVVDHEPEHHGHVDEPVERRVEERAEAARAAEVAGHHTVDEVEEAAGQQDAPREPEVPLSRTPRRPPSRSTRAEDRVSRFGLTGRLKRKREPELDPTIEMRARASP